MKKFKVTPAAIAEAEISESDRNPSAEEIEEFRNRITDEVIYATGENIRAQIHDETIISYLRCNEDERQRLIARTIANIKLLFEEA